mmetsp:Transcript_38262/g.51817  ORF Transcript_38262/g.51817 Transcript_38262/m.51817 type:complete len:188 (+) Transcript_38262:667-1230(+)
MTSNVGRLVQTLMLARSLLQPKSPNARYLHDLDGCARLMPCLFVAPLADGACSGHRLWEKNRIKLHIKEPDKVSEYHSPTQKSPECAPFDLYPDEFMEPVFCRSEQRKAKRLEECCDRCRTQTATACTGFTFRSRSGDGASTNGVCELFSCPTSHHHPLTLPAVKAYRGWDQVKVAVTSGEVAVTYT